MLLYLGRGYVKVLTFVIGRYVPVGESRVEICSGCIIPYLEPYYHLQSNFLVYYIMSRRSGRSASVPAASLSTFDRKKLINYHKSLKRQVGCMFNSGGSHRSHLIILLRVFLQCFLFSVFCARDSLSVLCLPRYVCFSATQFFCFPVCNEC